MWDFAADYYAANLTAEQRAVADRNGFPQKIPAPDKRNTGVGGATPRYCSRARCTLNCGCTSD